MSGGKGVMLLPTLLRSGRVGLAIAFWQALKVPAHIPTPVFAGNGTVDGAVAASNVSKSSHCGACPGGSIWTGRIRCRGRDRRGWRWQDG